jgi:uncharacterized protein YggE
MLSACAGGVAQPADDAMKNTISVIGFGEASGVPDTAMIQLGVSILGEDVTSAIDRSNATVERITVALSNLGIAADDIQTTNFNVWPDERFGPEFSAERQFRVESNLQIRVAGIEQVGEAIQVALEAGANNIYGLNFSIDDPSALISEARAAAIEDAKDRAAEIAEALGVELGEALVIAESSGGFVPQFSGKQLLAEDPRSVRDRPKSMRKSALLSPFRAKFVRNLPEA